MAASAPRSPGLARRLACAAYELLVIAALVLLATFPFLAFAGDSTSGWRRHLLQAYVLAMVGAYLVGFWTHGGQTLAMKTWRIRLECADGTPVGTARAAAPICPGPGGNRGRSESGTSGRSWTATGCSCTTGSRARALPTRPERPGRR